MCMGGMLGKIGGSGVAGVAGKFLPPLAGGVAGMLLKKKKKDTRPVAAVQPTGLAMGG